MFTVKQVLTDGTERFWEALDLSVDARYPDEASRPADYPRHPDYDDRVVRFFQPMSGGMSVQCSIDIGQVYVMNSTGKTLDQYRLGPHAMAPAHRPPNT